MKVLCLGLLSLVVGVNLSFGADNVVVNIDEVNISIDGKEKTYKEDERFHLSYDVEICLLHGKGQVVIKKASGEEIQLLLTPSSKKDCTSLKKATPPSSKSHWEQFLSFIGKEVVDEVVTAAGKKDYEDEENISVRDDD